MKLPSMTTGKQWLGLLTFVIVEAVLAFLCFQAGSPLSYVGIILVIAANVEWIGAAVKSNILPFPL